MLCSEAEYSSFAVGHAVQKSNNDNYGDYCKADTVKKVNQGIKIYP